MTHFYQELAAGKDKAEALHLSKLAYLEETKARLSHPYYWAGFVLLGDGQALKAETSQQWLWIVLGMAVLGAGGLLARRRISNKAA